MRFCKDCKHCDKDRFGGRYCSKFYRYETSLVTGKETLIHSTPCVTQRERDEAQGYCGAKGIFWEPRKPWWRFWR